MTTHPPGTCNRALRTVLDLCVPHRCAVCGRPGQPLCVTCAGRLPLAPRRPPPLGVDRLDALLAHTGAGRSVVTAAKYRTGDTLLELVGSSLSALLDRIVTDDRCAGRPGPVVTWAPTSSARARERGGDQAEVLARAAAAGSCQHPPVAGTLRRLGRGRQVGRDRADRIRSVSFEPLAGAGVGGTHVVVVDDVCTTGATLAAAATALRSAGAARVSGLVLAVRP